MVAVAFVVMAESVWAGRCLDGCCGRCAHRTRYYAMAPLGCCGLSMCGACSSTPIYGGCCGTSVYGGYWGMGWDSAGAWSSSCNCGATVSEESASPTEPTVAVPEESTAPAPATSAEPSVSQPPLHTVRPGERPAEITAPKAPAPQPANPPLPSPVKPVSPKKADAPVKKVAWSGHGLRVWSDATGSHQVTARFVSTLEDGAVVRLLRADGSFVRVAFAALSAEDQEYVLGQNAKVASAR